MPNDALSTDNFTQSDIICSQLFVYASGHTVVATWEYDDPNQDGLPYLTLHVFQLWMSLSNDRAHAFPFYSPHETVGVAYTIGAPTSPPQTLYHWVRAIDHSGRIGPFYPTSATGGAEVIIEA